MVSRQMRWTAIDYAWLLPLLARLPNQIANKVAACRGWFYAQIQRDWRVFSRIDLDVTVRTQMAAQRLSSVSRVDPRDLFVQRYIEQSKAEWRAELLAAKRVGIRPALPDDIPSYAVLITAHFAASIEAAYWLNQQAESLLMTSDVVYWPQVDSAVQGHYKRKYAQLLHQDVEKAPSAFIRQLKAKKRIIVLSDLPAEPEQALVVPTVMGNAYLAAGAKRMAETTNSPLMAYVAFWDGGAWQYRFSPVVYPSQQPDWHLPAYEWLVQQLLSQPEYWWTMDLLPMWQRD